MQNKKTFLNRILITVPSVTLVIIMNDELYDDKVNGIQIMILALLIGVLINQE